MDLFERGIRLVAAIVWGPHTLVLLLGVGFYLTLRLRFLQLATLPLTFRLLLRGEKYGEGTGERSGDISPLQALTTSLAGTIGNGNIAGVCTAIAMGGPGAVFWMWLSALVGMATKIAEVALGQKYRQMLPDGTVAGGPMYYIRHGLGLGWLAAILAFFMGSKPLFATTTIQSNSIALALEAQVGLHPLISGLALAFLVWIVIIGGIKSIGRVTVFLSPFMVLLYIGGGLVTVALFAAEIPRALQLIFVGAFNPQAVGGGVAGATLATAMRYGMARGVYSNEAGSGTAAVFHAAARTAEPARQGLIASLDVFIDTIVVCTLTALAVLVTGVWTEGTSSEMTVNAFNAALPGIGGAIVAASALLFGYSSLIANPYYGEISYAYLFGFRIRAPFRWIYCGMILLGAVLEVEVAWSIGDVLTGMMVFCNMIGVLGLAGMAVSVVRDYMGRLRGESGLGGREL